MHGGQWGRVVSAGSENRMLAEKQRHSGVKIAKAVLREFPI